MKKIFTIIVTAVIILVIFVVGSVAEAEKTIKTLSGDIYVIPVKGVVDPGLARFIERSIREANTERASAIVFEINTPGGLIDAAIDISEMIMETQIPTIALVNGEATSAGVLITISCDKVFMIPGSTIGAAEPRPKEEKVISYWTSKLRSAAERTGRDPDLVAAMADADIEIPDLIQKGKILSLTAVQAKELKLADEIVNNRADVLKHLSLTDKPVKELTPSLAEKIASFVTSPFVSPILLTIGFVGIITEILTPGFGFPGIIGLISLALFFGGHMIAGLAGWESIVFFLLGIIFLLIEALVPGFGVFGILGIIGIIGSIIAASVSIEQALISLTFSFIASIIILFFIFRFLTRSKLFDNLILSLKQDKDSGYKVSAENQTLLGRVGTTITPLRPAGTAEFDGIRMDVLSEGGFVGSNKKVKVVKIEGSKIVVREET
ncbi:MAG: hypothetical protein PWP66_164 [Thermosediminibacterales bacterium]|nr:hypothetical protein [Thermosediminibacterales bacterium]